MTGEDPQFGQGRLNECVDAEQLVEDIGLDAEEIACRKDFIGFDESDARTLEAFTDLFAANADEVAERFYDHLLSYDQTQAVVDRSPKTVEQLKQTQKAYLLSLARGSYDEAYFTNRARIGKLHELLDMPIKYYIAQYNVYYRLLLDLVTERVRDRLGATVEAELTSTAAEDDRSERFTQRLYDDIEEGLGELHSLLKLLNLDMQVAVDTYVQARIDDVERERDRFAALFENVPSPVVVVRITDDGMRVEEVNAAFEERFGYTASDLADQDFEHYLTPDGETQRPLDDRDVVENLQTDTASELSGAEVTLETQFGRREFIRVAAPVDRHDFDDLEYAFYIDVTDQKQRQERLQVLSRVLRHDLRNKLNVVKGCADTLAGETTTENEDQLLAAIVESADELLTTSRKIRRVERFVAGDESEQSLDMTTLVDDAVTDVRDQYPDCTYSVSGPDEA